MSATKPAETPELQPASTVGEFGGRERRTFSMEVDEVRDSGAGEGQFTIRGHAAVFDQWSLDLGGFRERVAPDAFDRVLGENPDVRLNWDHDSRWMLARTRNKTLELGTSDRGLTYWGRVAPTSYAEDLRVLMERGDVDEASFAFTVARDEWRITEEEGEERVERTILEVGELFDVTVTAMGAYPQTDSQVVRAHALAYAAERGVIPGVAPDDPAGAEPPEPQPELGEEDTDAARTAGAESTPLEDLKQSVNERAAEARAELERLRKELLQ